MLMVMAVAPENSARSAASRAAVIVLPDAAASPGRYAVWAPSVTLILEPSTDFMGSLNVTCMVPFPV